MDENMPKDYANIYNLSGTEKKIKIENLWRDSIPGTEELADSILKKINEDEYPYVLSVEAGYGMGKTHFFSRFCEYAKNNGFDCIYMSAWENDYQPSPFLFICNKIKSYMEEKNITTVKSQLSEFIDSSKRLMMETLKHVDISVSIIDIFKIKIKNLFSKSKFDPVQNFKLQLRELITTTRTKPLILVIDELDRCRPDYAIKTLEIIKHFFDVDNLYIILPINKEAIDYAVSSIYGDKNSNAEKYLKKMITQNLMLPQPTPLYYQKIVNTIITEEKLNNQLSKKYIEKNNNYNGYDIISECIGKYAHAGKLTYRETVTVCDEFICIVKQIKKKIHIEYLVYLLCDKYKHVPINFNIEHPFSQANGQTKVGKKKILTIENISSEANQILYSIPNDIQWGRLHNYMSTLAHNDSFTSYKEIFSYFDKLEDIKKETVRYQWRPNIAKRLNNLYDMVELSRKKIAEYQRQYGSTDEDTENQTFYDKLFMNPLSIYRK